MKQWLSSLGYQGTTLSFWLPPVIQFVVITAICAFILSFLDASLWDSWALGRAAEGTYCELNQMDRLIRQPSNSWSNFFYLFYGLLCIQFARNDARFKAGESTISQLPAVSWIYGFAFAYLCFGSFLFHASLTIQGQHWDMAATYGLTGVPVAFMFWRLFLKKLTGEYAAVVVVAMVLILDLLFYVFKWEMNSSIALPGLILTLVALMVIHKFMGNTHINYWIGAAGLAFFVLAYYIWLKDRGKIWCDPDSVLQGHAIWHGLTGLAAFCAYLMFRTEKPETAEVEV